VLQIDSTPRGAFVYIDGNQVKKATPIVVDLTEAQAARKLRVMVRRAGYQPYSTNVKPEDFTEEPDRMMFVVRATLISARPIQPSPTVQPTPTTGGESGSAAAPPPAEPKPADPKPADPTGSASPGEPAPDWTK
jgi:hypothetical protein